MRKKFRIVKVNEPKQHKSGKWSVPCFTARGICIAAWDFDTTQILTAAKVPFDLSCDCSIPPRGVFEQFGHNFWINNRYKITIN
jgi:hypothetical protein